MAIAEALIGRHLELAAVPARDAVLRALALVPRRRRSPCGCTPTTAATLPDTSTALPGGHVVLVADPAVEPPARVAEAGDRTVDARLGPRSSACARCWPMTISDRVPRPARSTAAPPRPQVPGG